MPRRSEQSEMRMPSTGEGWRHYKGDLYTIVGKAVDHEGNPLVVYCNYGWSLAQLPMLFVRPLSNFLEEVGDLKDSYVGPRFKFEREPWDEKCPFIKTPQQRGLPTFEEPVVYDQTKR